MILETQKIMPRRAWWIDEPLVRASSNPTDAELAGFRTQGFSVAMSFLEESKEPPRYDRKSAELAGWSIYSIPIVEGGAPSLDQVYEFSARLRGLPEGTKVLVRCDSGLGRSAFMGAVYWVMKGLTAREAIERVTQAALTAEWKTPERQKLLLEYERLQELSIRKS